VKLYHTPLETSSSPLQLIQRFHIVLRSQTEARTQIKILSQSATAWTDEQEQWKTKKSWQIVLFQYLEKIPDKLLSLFLVSPCSTPDKVEREESSSSHQRGSNNKGKRIQMVLVSPRLHLGLLLDKENVLVNHKELDRQRGGGA
jgi:hypothetical protein